MSAILSGEFVDPAYIALGIAALAITGLLVAFGTALPLFGARPCRWRRARELNRAMLTGWRCEACGASEVTADGRRPRACLKPAEGEG